MLYSETTTLFTPKKGRPKRTKTRAPTRALLTEPNAIGEGLDTFFGPGSLTPTTLTPLVSPTSDECSSLSFMDSPTLSRCEDNGKHYFSSEETTPVLEDRRTLKYQSSPLLKGVAWTPRSISSDHLEKYSPGLSRKSPLLKSHLKPVTTTVGATADVGKHSNGGGVSGPQERPKIAPKVFVKNRTPSNESIKSVEADLMLSLKTNETRTPTLPPKPRPWSVAGNEGKCEFTAAIASNLTTPETIDSGI